jgi:hypothetical protein
MISTLAPAISSLANSASASEPAPSPQLHAASCGIFLFRECNVRKTQRYPHHHLHATRTVPLTRHADFCLPYNSWICASVSVPPALVESYSPSRLSLVCSHAKYRFRRARCVTLVSMPRDTLSRVACTLFSFNRDDCARIAMESCEVIMSAEKRNYAWLLVFHSLLCAHSTAEIHPRVRVKHQM